MIATNDAIAAGRALLGTPYSTLDCINFIKRIIRTAPGGVSNYTTAGTNSLWQSYDMTAKYRDLTWRQEGTAGAKAGMLAFKRTGPNVHHVGLVTGDGTVLHSSSTRQQVVETALDSSWHLLAVHRYIQTDNPATQEEESEGNSMAALYKATVHASPSLRIRARAVDGKIIGHIPDGETVDVLTAGDWPRVRYGNAVGYVSGDYLEAVQQPEAGGSSTEETGRAVTTLINDAGQPITLLGNWHVGED